MNIPFKNPFQAPQKIALIDDCKTVRDNFELRMKNLGWLTASFGNSFGVAIKIIEFSPAIILLDVEMPGLTGQGLSRVLKNKRCLPDTIIYYYSSLNSSKLAELTQASGLDGYFEKSTSFEDLNQQLRNKLNGQTLRA